MADASRRGIWEMTAAMAMSGTIGWFVVMSGEPPVNVVFWRCLFGFPALLLICRLGGHLRWAAFDRRRLMLAIAGGIALVLNWLALFSAYPLASISVATIVYNVQPFLLVGLGVLFLGEKVSRSKVFWLIVAFAGTVAMTMGGVQVGTAAGPSGYLLGILLSLTAAFCYALAALAARQLKGTPPQLIALVQVATGAVMLAPLSDWTSLPSTPATWSMLATLGFVHTGLMYALLYSAIQRLPVALTGTLSFLYPVVAVLVDIFAFGHVLTATQAVGAAGILLAAVAATLNWAPPFLNSLRTKENRA